MKKTISINISGIIFHVEEDCYDKLKNYLDSIHKYFSSFEDSNEILSDVESRIAEIFLSKLKEGKQIITAIDIEYLIATMGEVSHFKAAEETEDFRSSSSNEQSSTKETSAPKKLYRDNKKKILGGICAGIANYLHIDSVWIRIIMICLLLGTGGIFIIVYLILWIVLPSADLEENPSVKKLFRDADKKVVGGVSAGIASFFHTDTSLVRILFVVATFFSGMGLVAYIILWIVLPTAKTITEKMQMEGEAFTLSNIESSAKKARSEKKSDDETILTKIILFPFRAFATLISALAKFIGPVFTVFMNIIRLALGLVFTLTGVLFFIALLLALGVILGIFAFPHWNLVGDWAVVYSSFPYEAVRNTINTWPVFFLFLMLFIPAIFIIMLGGSILINRSLFNKTIGFSLLGIFILSIILVAVSLPTIIYSFREEGTYPVENTFKSSRKNIILKVNDIGMEDYDFVTLTLKSYKKEDIKLIEKFTAQGPSRRVASENAKMVDYNVVLKDSILEFDMGLNFKPNAIFRAQRLDMELYVPEDKTVILDKTMGSLIGNYEIRESLTYDEQKWQFTDMGWTCLTCGEYYQNSNQDPENELNLSDFNSVELHGDLNVKIQQGDKYSVQLKGPEKIKQQYSLSIKDETLVVKYNYKKLNSLWADKNVELNITMPEINAIDISGAGRLFLNRLNAHKMKLNCLGAVKINGFLTVDKLYLTVSGASTVDISGGGDLLKANITGASSLIATDYKVERGVIEARGASKAKVFVTETLEIDKGLACVVTYKGNPEVVKD